MFKFVILSLFLTQYAAGQQPEVKVEQGTLKGVFTESISHRKISSFLGVPYAQPPVGNLRFREPQDPSPWLGDWNATQLPPECLQYNQIGGVIQGSEDCLYLSVFVPEEVKTHKELLDVVVNIPGGGFMFFSSNFYGPEYLLDKDVILVNVNYRLGILGFLSTGDEVVPGNNGLKDQLAALKWVQKNIKNFGGDPNKVTLVGLSAGGASTHYHVISPKSKGLFHKAIIMSGSVLCPWAQAEKVKEKGALMAHRLGCPTDSSVKMVECLKERPAHHLVDTKAFAAWLNYPFTFFAPVAEPSHPDAFIDRPPSTYIKNNLFNDVPIIFSLSADEGLWPGAELLVDPKKMSYLDDNWNAVAPHVIDFNFTVPKTLHSEIGDKINLEYFGNDDIKISHKALVELIGDRHFNLPVSMAAKLQAARSKSPVYAMLFSYIGTTGLQDLYGLSKEIYPGTSHGDDLPFVLRASYNVHDLEPEAMMVSKRMVDLWFDFITGQEMPNGWKPLKESLPSYSYMNIGSYSPTKDNFVVEEDFGRAKFWLGLNFLEDGMEKQVHEEL